MPHLSRRDVFRALAAVGVSSLVGCKDTGDGPLANANTLNIIFHGPFIFLSYPDKVEVIAADVGGHVYGVGNWKKEYVMPKMDYILEGLTNQTWISSNEDKKIKFANPSVDLSKCYCKIVLKPGPAKIVPLGWFALPPRVNLFSGADSPGPNQVRVLASSHACVYYSVPKPKLSNTYWTPEPNSLGATNLHFIATPFIQMDMNHPVDSFAKLAEMLPTVKLSLDKGALNNDFDFKDPSCSRLEGMFREEQAPLRAPLSTNIESCDEGHHLIPPRICDAPSLFVTIQ